MNKEIKTYNNRQVLTDQEICDLPAKIIDNELTDLKKWLKKSKEIQWDYKNIVKRKGQLEKLN